MGLCWNHTVTRTKQGSVGVIWAQQDSSSGRDNSWTQSKRGDSGGGGAGMGGSREGGVEPL